MGKTIHSYHYSLFFADQLRNVSCCVLAAVWKLCCIEVRNQETDLAEILLRLSKTPRLHAMQRNRVSLRNRWPGLAFDLSRNCQEYIPINLTCKLLTSFHICKPEQPKQNASANSCNCTPCVPDPCRIKATQQVHSEGLTCWTFAGPDSRLLLP